jgi:hypothetical protein
MITLAPGIIVSAPAIVLEGRKKGFRPARSVADYPCLLQVQKATSRHPSFDHLVGALPELWRYLEAKRLCRLRLMTGSNFVGNCTGSSAGFAPLRTRIDLAACERPSTTMSWKS